MDKKILKTIKPLKAALLIQKMSQVKVTVLVKIAKYTLVFSREGHLMHKKIWGKNQHLVRGLNFAIRPSFILLIFLKTFLKF